VARAVLTARPLLVESPHALPEVHRRLAEDAVAAEHVTFSWWPTPTGVGTEIVFRVRQDDHYARPLPSVTLRGELTAGRGTEFRGVIRRDLAVLNIVVSILLLISVSVALVCAPLVLVVSRRIGDAAVALSAAAVLGAVAYINNRPLVGAVDVHVRLLERAFGEPVRFGTSPAHRR
jgi:hypothetical protein